MGHLREYMARTKGFGIFSKLAPPPNADSFGAVSCSIYNTIFSEKLSGQGLCYIPTARHFYAYFPVSDCREGGIKSFYLALFILDKPHFSQNCKYSNRYVSYSCPRREAGRDFNMPQTILERKFFQLSSGTDCNYKGLFFKPVPERRQGLFCIPGITYTK